MKEKNIIITFEDLNRIEMELSLNLSKEETIRIIHDFCNNPVFINSLYYIEKYDEFDQERIKYLANLFKKNKTTLYSKIYKTKSLFRVSLEDLVDRLKKINLAYSVVSSDLSDYMKAEKLVSLFESSEDLKRMYSGMLRNINEPNIQIAREALNNFELIYNKYIEYEKNGIMNNARYIVNTMNYHRNYGYAKFVIEKYIESENSYKGFEFLQTLGLDKDAFIFCVKTIEELDPDLYKKFVEKRRNNKKVNCFKNIKTFKDLSNGIETGILNDGTSFDLIEFIKRVPFKREENFFEILKKFVINFNPNEYKTIINYIYSNNLHKKYAFSPINEEKLNEENIKINGIEITPEINEVVFDYLKINQIPLVNRTYSIILRKYLSGEITNEMVEQQKSEKVDNNKEMVLLIPHTYKKAC